MSQPEMQQGSVLGPFALACSWCLQTTTSYSLCELSRCPHKNIVLEVCPIDCLGLVVDEIVNKGHFVVLGQKGFDVTRTS